MNSPTTDRPSPAADHSQRKVVLTAALGLLGMAILAPFAQFGVLQTLVVPDDPMATFNNIVSQAGLFQAAIVAFAIVVILDVIVAWAFYVLLRPVNKTLALIVAWLRVIYGVAFAFVLINLARVVQLTSEGASAADQGAPAVASSIAAFNTSWDIALGIFGLHLLGLGFLMFRSADFPRILSALIVLAGVGYLADALGTIFVAGYGLTISLYTFVGEALLIIWLFWMAWKGRPTAQAIGSAESPAALGETAEPVGEVAP
ncbi:MAG: DUF4386 domain-containing protein [Aeromicrobium sp.]